MAIKRITIVGVTGCKNRGVEALVVSTLAGLKEQFGLCQVTILTEDADFDRWRLRDHDVRIVPVAYFRLGRVRSPAWVRSATAAQAALSARHRLVLAALRDSDYVILSGGDMLSSDYSTLSLSRSLDWAHIGHAFGRKVVALGHSIGQFRGDEHQRLWRRAAGRFSLVTYREGLSRRLLVEAGLPEGTKAETTADSAFLLPRLSGNESDRLLAHYGITGAGRFGIIVPSAGICRYGKKDSTAHLDQLVRLAEALLHGHVEQLLLLPHVSEGKVANNDALLVMEMTKRLGYDPRVTPVSGEHTAVEFKTIIARAEFVITERMHAAIAGLGTAVPTLVIGYSVKAAGILEEVLGADCAAKCQIPIGDFITRPIEPWLRDFMEGRPQLRARMSGQAALLRNSALQNFRSLGQI